MSTNNSKNFDESLIKKAKEYAENKGLEVLRGTIEAFEMELESNYKSEIYEIIKGMLERIDAQDRRLAQYRATHG